LPQIENERTRPTHLGFETLHLLTYRDVPWSTPSHTRAVSYRVHDCRSTACVCLANPAPRKPKTDAWSDERLGAGADVANRRESNGPLINYANTPVTLL
jgi:hypothetical protein